MRRATHRAAGFSPRDSPCMGRGAVRVPLLCQQWPIAVATPPLKRWANRPARAVVLSRGLQPARSFMSSFHRESRDDAAEDSRRAPGVTAALIFAKRPIPGLVKTRLVPPLTEIQAAELHALSLAAVVEGTRKCHDVTPIWVVTPDESAEIGGAPRSLDVHDVWPQGDGDLGARLDRAVRRAMDCGFERVVLLGADSPTLPEDTLFRTRELLDDHDAVIGPCEDGGYYLLALKAPCTALFRDIPWSQSTVFEITVQRARAEGLRLACLPVWYDLDRMDDLHRADTELVAIDPRRCPAAAALSDILRQLLAPQG